MSRASQDEEQHDLVIDDAGEQRHENDSASSRRAFASLLGAFGALALTGCTDADGGGAPGKLEPGEPDLDELSQALAGAGVLKVADTAAQLRTITGGTTLWVAVLQGIAAAGDAGGGVYYWSTTAQADDGWSALNAGAANIAGWRRVNRYLVVEGVPTSALASRSGVRPWELVTTTGRAAAGDGGGATFCFAQGISAGADGFDRINAPNGQWQRLKDASDTTLKSRGLALDNVTDDTTALTAVLRSLGASAPGSELVLQPSGVQVGRTFIRITDSVIIDGVSGAARVRGGGGHGQAHCGCVWVWDRPGPADRPMLIFRAHSTVMENIQFTSAPGRNCQQYVNFDQLGANPTTKSTFRNCQFTGLAGYTTDLVTVDYYNTSTNIEDISFIDCAFYDATRYYINIVGGQPYNFLVERCFILNSNNLEMQGVGIRSIKSSFNGVARNTFFYNLEAMLAGQLTWSMEDCTSERCKRLFDGEGFTGYAAPVKIVGGRHSTDGITRASHGPRNIPANDRSFILQGGGGALTIENVFFDNGAADVDMKVASYGRAPINSFGNLYPNASPYSAGGLSAGDKVGGVFATGDVHQGALSLAEAIPPRFGCLNPDGYVTISGSNTFVNVSLPVAECNLEYAVYLSIAAVSGTPAAASYNGYVSNLTNSSFRINLQAAPGGSAVQGVAYALRRRPA